jgi:arabinose-5-phosphate isomerase
MANSESYKRVSRVLNAASSSINAINKIEPSFWSNLLSTLEERDGRFILTGVGKSGYVAMKIAATFTSLGHDAVFVHPVEALHGDSGAVRDGDTIIAFSYSGNTKELVQFVRHVGKHTNILVIGVTGDSSSALAQVSDIVLPIDREEEGCPLNLAPMASTTAMLVMGDALAALLTSPEDFTKEDFARFHPSGSLGLSLTKVAERVTFDVNCIVDENDPLRTVLIRMGEVGKGIVAVTRSDGALIGSITDGDVRRYFATHEPTHDACAKHVMSTTPKSIVLHENLKDALTLMEHHKITNLFVVEETGELVGIIHIHDIVES